MAIFDNIVDMAGENNLTYPTSGVIIGKLAVFFDLRQEIEDRIEESGKTVQRYFNGERIKDETIREIITAFVKSFIPPSVLPERVFGTENPIEKLIEVISQISLEWDRLTGKLNSGYFPPTDKNWLLVPVWRLATFDLGIRWAAFQTLLLEDGKEPDLRPEFLKPDAFSRKIKDLKKGSLEELAGLIGHSETMVKKWIKGDALARRSVDDEKVLDAVIREYSKVSGKPANNAQFDVRLALGISNFWRSSFETIGKNIVESYRLGFRRTVKQAYGFFNSSLSEVENKNQHLYEVLAKGARSPLGRDCAVNLSDNASDQDVQADFIAITKIPVDRISEWNSCIFQKDKLPDFEQMGLPEDFKQFLTLDKIAKTVEALLCISDFTKSAKEFKYGVRVSGPPQIKAINRYNQACRQRSVGDIPGAIEHMRHAVKWQPENAQYHFVLGGYLGEYAKAIVFMQLNILTGSMPSLTSQERADLAIGLVKELNLESVINEAVHECEIASALQLEWIRPRVEIAVIKSNIGLLDEALEVLSKIPMEKHDQHSLFTKGVCHLWKEQYSESVESFSAIKEKFPGNAEGIKYLAISLFAVGKDKEARKLLKEVKHKSGFEDIESRWKEFTIFPGTLA